MNDELVKLMKEAYEGGKTSVLQIVNFAKEQAPLLVEQLLRWKFAMYTIWATIGLLGILGTLWWNIKSVHDEKSLYCSSYEDGKTAMTCIWGCMYAIFALVFLATGTVALKIAVAPNLYIFEYITAWLF